MMWVLRLKGGTEITEEQMRFWDNVPQNVEIEALAMAIQRQGAAPYILEMKGYEEYCVERMGAFVAGATRMTGYCLLGIKDAQVFKVEVRPDGMRFESYHRYTSKTPDRCWRRGI
jgi:hypothetical protein